MTLLLPMALMLWINAPVAPELSYHLTARPWKPLETPQAAYLDAVEDLCRFAAKHQNADGAFVDPLLQREHQYATPYFAFAVGLLVQEGRAMDLLAKGVRAMDHATACMSKGPRAIPDGHGEFFLAPLAGALELYSKHVPADTMSQWRARLAGPLLDVIEGPGARINNWRTYAMKGAWSRYRAGLAERDVAVSFIEDAWLHRTQRERIAADRWALYQDWSSDPQSHAVEAVGRGNLLGLLAAGYDGDSAPAMWGLVRCGTRTSLFLQDPSGQCPPNGRTDDHVFNDVLYQLLFETMAETLWQEKDPWQAGQYRRAALLSFSSIARWRRTEEPWQGMYSITKNHFDPAERVGYQPASNIGNYSGAVMYHLAEAYRIRQSDIPERPAPCEIGGYVLEMDARFGSAVANAGGMQLFANLRGDTVPKYGTYWTPLGVVRFARMGWDSRLGPSDGVRDTRSREALTFGPAWKEARGRWVTLAQKAKDYQGTLRVDFVHPLLVRCTILYHSVTGVGGPSFYHDFVITPDGVLATLHAPQEVECGVSLPILENDGRPLQVTRSEAMISVSYAEGEDAQHFIVLGPGARIEEAGDPIRSSYGWLRPLRARADGTPLRVFVYPSSPGDPAAHMVRDSITLTETGFRSVLGRVEGNTYVGRTAAGGAADGIDFDGDGQREVAWDAPCGFLLQRDGDRVNAAETGHAVTGAITGRRVSFESFTPLYGLTP